MAMRSNIVTAFSTSCGSLRFRAGLVESESSLTQVTDFHLAELYLLYLVLPCFIIFSYHILSILSKGGKVCKTSDFCHCDLLKWWTQYFPEFSSFHQLLYLRLFHDLLEKTRDTPSYNFQEKKLEGKSLSAPM